MGNLFGTMAPPPPQNIEVETNILQSMNNDYLFVLQNKYNQLQKENNTLLRDELSVIDEHRRNRIKEKYSLKIFLILIVLLVIVIIIYVVASSNDMAYFAISIIIPIVLIVVLVWIFGNVAYFKKHSNINVNDLNTIPHEFKEEELESNVEEPSPEQCYTMSQSGPFNYIDPNNNKQIQDTLTTIGNINDSLIKLNALKKHFKNEDKYMPDFVKLLNNFIKDRVNILERPQFDTINSIEDLDQIYNEYQQTVSSVESNMYEELGNQVYNIFMTYQVTNGNLTGDNSDCVLSDTYAKKYSSDSDKLTNMKTMCESLEVNTCMSEGIDGSCQLKQKDDANWDGNIKDENIQGSLSTNVVFGLSQSEFESNLSDKANLANYFLNAQKLNNYFDSFKKWIQDQINIASENYNNKLNQLNGNPSTAILNENTFTGHVGIPDT